MERLLLYPGAIAGGSMKAITAGMMIMAAALVLQGCYSSAAGQGDGRTDGQDVLQDDAAPDAVPDTVPDIGPDPTDIVPETTPVAPYRLHEWGVISWNAAGAQAHGPSPESAYAEVDKPVIYLYSDGGYGPLDISVDMTAGRASEVWPDIPLGSRLEWNNLAIRPGPCEQTPFPYPFTEAPCEVCNLASAVVEEADCITFTGSDGLETRSRLLFYAGPLSDYRPPLTGEAHFLLTDDENGLVEMALHNGSTRDIRDLWIIYRETASSCIEPWMGCPLLAASIAYKHVEHLGPEQDFLDLLPVEVYRAPVDESGWPMGDLPLPDAWLDQGKELQDRLTAQGLTDKEAGAFMRNWDTVFFGLLGDDAYAVEPLYANGFYVVYFMDRQDYDAQFPLRAEPPPEELVRVGMIYQSLPYYNE
jgi:hypothetical protein